MRPIIGGYVPPDRVVGRDAFIQKMWRTLENQSIVLVSERRIGKTSVIRKMAMDGREGWHPIFMVIEGVRSPTEFIFRIVDAVSPILSQKNRMWSRLQQVYEEIGGGKIGNWELPSIRSSWMRKIRLTSDTMRSALKFTTATTNRR